MTKTLPWQGIWLLRGRGNSEGLVDLGLDLQQLCTQLVQSQTIPPGARCKAEASYPLKPVHLGVWCCSFSVKWGVKLNNLGPPGHRLGFSNWEACCQGTLWPCTCSSPRVHWLATAGRVRGQGVNITVLAVMPHTMLHGYEITFSHRAALPISQEVACPWAWTGRALAL